MTVHWLIEKSVVEGEEQRIADAIRGEGFDCKTLDFAPFMDDSAFLDLFGDGECVVCYGSIQFAARVKQAAQWTPGVFANLDACNCTYYYPRFGSHLLNESYVMLAFGDLDRRKEFLFEKLAANRLFIRPNSAAKLFTGKVVDRTSWDRDLRLFAFYDVPPETLVVVAPAQEVLREWRFVVVEGEVVAGSLYMEHGEQQEAAGAPQEVSVYAQQVAADTTFCPDQAWTLDICETPKGFRVVEVGAFSTSSLYRCDWAVIARNVSEAAMKAWKAV